LNFLYPCGSCGYLIDRSAVDPQLRIRRRSFDLSSTYDGVNIASLRFKEHVQRVRYAGVDFLPLPADPDFFVIRPQTTVPFDSARRRTRFEKPCPACGQYESVVGVTPPFLRQSNPLSDGFFRTDLEFGSGDAKSALLLVGAATRERLEREHFSDPKASTRAACSPRAKARAMPAAFFPRASMAFARPNGWPRR